MFNNVNLLKFKEIFIKNIEIFNIYLLCFTFYEPSILPHYLFLLIKYLVLIYLFLSYRENIAKLKFLKYFIFIYGGINILSSIINLMPFNTIIASCFYALQILVVFIVVNNFNEKEKIKSLIKHVFIFFGVYLLINDILMIFIDYEFSNPNENYFIGNKFVVSYVHCFISIIYLFIFKEFDYDIKIHIKNSQISIKFLSLLVMFLYNIIICKIVTCTTGVLMGVLIIFISFIPKKYHKYYKYGIQIVSVLLILNFILLGPLNILDSQLVKDFMTNVLNKSSNLTGRTIIWNKIFEIFSQKPIFGYGYYSSIVENVVSFGNPQNGVLKLLIDNGIIGLISYCFIMYFSFNKNENDTYPFVIFIYAIILASLVEIPFNHMIVFMVMAIASIGSKKDSFKFK